MRALLPDGRVLSGSFLGMTTGYVAQAIMLEPDDVRQMAALAKRSPDRFEAHMRQLEMRFESERAPASVVEDAHHFHECTVFHGGPCVCVELGGYR